MNWFLAWDGIFSQYFFRSFIIRSLFFFYLRLAKQKSSLALSRLLLFHLHQRQRDHQQLCRRLLRREEDCLWCHFEESGDVRPAEDSGLSSHDSDHNLDWQECNSTECRIPLSFMSEEHLVLEVKKISDDFKMFFCFTGSPTRERRVRIWSGGSDKLLPV